MSGSGVVVSGKRSFPPRRVPSPRRCMASRGPRCSRASASVWTCLHTTYRPYPYEYILACFLSIPHFRGRAAGEHHEHKGWLALRMSLTSTHPYNCTLISFISLYIFVHTPYMHTYVICMYMGASVRTQWYWYANPRAYR